MNFAELYESIRAEEASRENLFGDLGGSARRRRKSTPDYLKRLAEAATFYAEVLDGSRRLSQFSEAMSTSDFPLLFGDIVDRQMLTKYMAWPVVWPGIARRSTVADFRSVRRFTISGADNQLDAVNELAPYPQAALTEARYTIAVGKYGREIAFSWESLVNDDLDALRDLPETLARGARRSEDRYVTDLFCGSTGPDGTVYAAGNANIVTANPVLSIAGLQTAMTVLGAMLDTNGEPIVIETVTLVVPPALEVVANNILNATMIRAVTAGGATGQEIEVVNWMRNKVTLKVDPYIPIIASSSNGNTSWFLFANPANGRPAIDFAFLRGHEQPEVFEKMPNARRVGGGENPEDGDFEHDKRAWKVRHVFGGAVVDPKMTVASNGSGS